MNALQLVFASCSLLAAIISEKSWMGSASSSGPQLSGLPNSKDDATVSVGGMSAPSLVSWHSAGC